jgi:hypothetical protein
MALLRHLKPSEGRTKQSLQMLLYRLAAKQVFVSVSPHDWHAWLQLLAPTVVARVGLQGVHSALFRTRCRKFNLLEGAERTPIE